MQLLRRYSVAAKEVVNFGVLNFESLSLAAICKFSESGCMLSLLLESCRLWHISVGSLTINVPLILIHGCCILVEIVDFQS